MNEPEYQKEIIRRLAEKYGKSYEVMHRIYYFQFKFVNTVMRKGTFEKVLLNGFGSWSVKVGRVFKVNQNGKAKNTGVLSE